MTRVEAIDNLLILKKSAEETVGNRQQNIEYTILHDIKPSSFSFVVDMAIEALKQQLCEDAISRQDVFELVEKMMMGLSEDAYNELYRGIDKIPSVTPIRPKGHWEVKHDEWMKPRLVVCSNCKDCYNPQKVKYMKFCPNCGADMREVKE